jgi:hypothetical protein
VGSIISEFGEAQDLAASEVVPTMIANFLGFKRVAGADRNGTSRDPAARVSRRWEFPRRRCNDLPVEAHEIYHLSGQG